MNDNDEVKFWVFLSLGYIKSLLEILAEDSQSCEICDSATASTKMEIQIVLCLEQVERF